MIPSHILNGASTLKGIKAGTGKSPQLKVPDLGSTLRPEWLNDHIFLMSDEGQRR